MLAVKHCFVYKDYQLVCYTQQLSMLLNKKIPILFYLRTIRREIVFVFLFANLVVLTKYIFDLRYVAIPLIVPTLLGTCISLLLAFRTSQAYDRWWEARILWGAITNDSRSFIRQLQVFLPNQFELLHSFVQRHCAWCHGLADSLRGVNANRRLIEFLLAEEVQSLKISDNLPNLLLQGHGLALGKLYESGQLTDYQVGQINTILDRLTDSMGGCERIKNTVFPRTYTFNMELLIYVFTAILPFCFMEDIYYLDVPLVTLISSIFILIEKSAIQLQDPFENRPTDTPIAAIALSIEIDIKTMTAYQVIPVKPAPHKYYLM